MKKLNIAKVQQIIQMAIEEDLGQGDMTSGASL
jgi:nicotinate-nucleotide pyrophosphorylase